MDDAVTIARRRALLVGDVAVLSHRRDLDPALADAAVRRCDRCGAHVLRDVPCRTPHDAYAPTVGPAPLEVAS